MNNAETGLKVLASISPMAISLLAVLGTSALFGAEASPLLFHVLESSTPAQMLDCLIKEGGPTLALGMLRLGREHFSELQTIGVVGLITSAVSGVVVAAKNLDPELTIS